MLRNHFVRAAAIAALVYFLFQLISVGIGTFLMILESFSRWYRLRGVPLAEETAITVGLLYLFFVAVTSSKSNWLNYVQSNPLREKFWLILLQIPSLK